MKDRGIVQSECTWSEVANFSDTASNHHCYYPRVINRAYDDSYFGVGALCNKNWRISEDGETSVEIDDVIPSNSSVGRCKSCEKIFRKIEND